VFVIGVIEKRYFVGIAASRINLVAAGLACCVASVLAGTLPLG